MTQPSPNPVGSGLPEASHRQPGELVPVKEREVPELRLVCRVDRDPEQPDVGQHEQQVLPARPGRPRVLGYDAIGLVRIC
jgi:hypothetical protein